MASQTTRPVLRIWSDFHCPWAYCLRVRLEKVRPEYKHRIQFRFLSWPLEVINKHCTPKDILDVESPICAAQEPAARFQSWRRPDWTWPVTILPAFEAAKCAEAQGDDAAAGYDLAVREAFFAQSETISMRHVLIDIARQIGLDSRRFHEDFDSGKFKPAVMSELADGRKLGVRSSPTVVTPDDKLLKLFTLTLPKMTPDHKVAQVVPPEFTPDEAVGKIRELLQNLLH